MHSGRSRYLWRRWPKIPDKPTLDGIESAMGRAVGGRRHVPLRPHRRSRQTCSRSTPRRRPCQRLAPHGPRVRLHPHRRHRPLPADARQGGLLSRSAGTTTAWPPSVGCRTSTACAATRRSPTTPTSQPPDGDDAEGPPEMPDQPAQLRRAVPRAHAPTTRRSSRSLFRRLGLSVRLVADSTRRSTTPAGASASWRSCATSPAARPTAPRRRRCGTSTTARAVAQAELEDRERPGALPPHRVPRRRRRRPIDRHDPARAASPAASRWSPIPTTSATSRCSARRCARRCSTSRCPVLAHPLAEPDKGTGIAMVCTFGDTTDVTWWRELDLPTRSVIGRDGRHRRIDARRTGSTDAARAARAYAELAGKTVKQAQARDRRAADRTSASCTASRGRSPTR